MKTLRSLGIAFLLLSYLFKTMHWPGAHLLALSGFLAAACGSLLPLIVGQRTGTAGSLLRPVLAILLYGTALMHMLELPGGKLLFYGAVVTTIVFLLSDRTHFELARWKDLGALPLLGAGLLFSLGGVCFKVMHWPSASIQLLIGITCCVAWTLVNAFQRQRAS